MDPPFLCQLLSRRIVFEHPRCPLPLPDWMNSKDPITTVRLAVDEIANTHHIVELGLAVMQTQKSSHSANTAPDTIINTLPAIRVRLLPARSATSVSRSDKTTSPSRTFVRRRVEKVWGVVF